MRTDVSFILWCLKKVSVDVTYLTFIFIFIGLVLDPYRLARTSIAIIATAKKNAETSSHGFFEI